MTYITELQDVNVPMDEHPIFTRRVIANFGGLRGYGLLTLTPGHLTLAATGGLALFSGVKRVVHEVPDVTHLTTNITLPWMRSHLIVVGESDVGVAKTPLDAQLRAALTQAGFSVREERAWFSIGGYAIRRGPPDATNPEGPRQAEDETIPPPAPKWLLAAGVFLASVTLVGGLNTTISKLWVVILSLAAFISGLVAAWRLTPSWVQRRHRVSMRWYFALTALFLGVLVLVRAALGSDPDVIPIWVTTIGGFVGGAAVGAQLAISQLSRKRTMRLSGRQVPREE